MFEAVDLGRTTILITFDLSTAFDNIDHSILLNRLQSSFGVTLSCLSWVRLCLTDQTIFIKVGCASYHIVFCNTGVQQVSVLGPLLLVSLFLSL